MNKPKVIVLMATFNGMAWLPEQISSILNQTGVDVTLVISDDHSSDSTYDYLKKISIAGSRVRVLPQTKKFGAAGKNFYNLINSVDLSGIDYVAFSDQDDIWHVEKLIKHINISKSQSADGVSSNVTAFWANQKSSQLLDKASPQRELDYLFESAGPGCTFLMSPWLVTTVKKMLLDDVSPAKKVALHDWLTYAICRANAKHWVIDPEPSVMYRQHDNNVVGANVGFKAKLMRLKKLKSNWYKSEIINVAETCQKISFNPKVQELLYLLKSKSFFARFKLIKFVPLARRSLFDRLTLVIAVLLGLI